MRFCVGECSIPLLLWVGANVVAGSSFGDTKARVTHEVARCSSLVQTQCAKKADETRGRACREQPNGCFDDQFSGTHDSVETRETRVSIHRNIASTSSLKDRRTSDLQLTLGGPFVIRSWLASPTRRDVSRCSAH